MCPVTAGRGRTGITAALSDHWYTTTHHPPPTAPAPPCTIHPQSHACLSATCLPLPLISALASCRQLSACRPCDFKSSSGGGRRGNTHQRGCHLVCGGERRKGFLPPPVRSSVQSSRRQLRHRKLPASSRLRTSRLQTSQCKTVLVGDRHVKMQCSILCTQSKNPSGTWKGPLVANAVSALASSGTGVTNLRGY